MPGYCCVLFLRRSLGGKHLMCFQSETSVFKLLRRSVACERRIFPAETSDSRKYVCVRRLGALWTKTFDACETSVLNSPAYCGEC